MVFTKDRIIKDYKEFQKTRTQERVHKKSFMTSLLLFLQSRINTIQKMKTVKIWTLQR